MVYRKQAYFCNRCGARVEKMYEGKLIRFEEDHTCDPKNVLKRKVDIMTGEWVEKPKYDGVGGFTRGSFKTKKFNRGW